MMNRSYISAMFIMGIGTVIAAFGQLLLKKSAIKHYESPIQFYLNKYVIVGYSFFLLSTIFSLYGLKILPLSLSPAIEGFAQLVTALFSVMFLKERISSKKELGILLIVIGLFIVCV